MVMVVVSRATAIATVLLVALQSGCAEGASPFGDVGSDDGASGAGGGATFTRVWTEVLSAKGCSGPLCHGAMPAAGGMSFRDQSTAYLNLVNSPAAGPACKTSGRFRVKAGDPNMSVLVEKMSSAMPSCGTPMPPGAGVAPNCAMPTPLTCNSMAEIALVKSWIAAGAKND